MTAEAAGFDACLAFVWGPSRDGQKNDRAPGEGFATAYGVTAYTWSHAQQQGIVQGDIDDATQDQCRAILRALFWNVLRCGSLPAGVGLMVFNDGVLAGTGHAGRLLQRIIGAEVDGVIGPQTIRLAAGFGDKALIDALATADEQYFASLAKAPLFLNGWDRREEAARQLAHRMAGT